MGNKNAAQVRDKLQRSSYASLIKQIYGGSIFDNADAALNAAANAIVAYEQGPEFALFSSKYDYYLQGKVALTAQEQNGLQVFEAEDKGNCAACHPNSVGDNGEPPLFTDFSYDNLGAGKNNKLPFLMMDKTINPDGTHYRDMGLALNQNIDNAADQKGKFKVPTLRNIELSGPYLHNGLFETLEEIVGFYNTRDTDEKWPAAEVSENVNTEELGDLGLTDQEVSDLIVYLKTLTDGYRLPEQ